MISLDWRDGLIVGILLCSFVAGMGGVLGSFVWFDGYRRIVDEKLNLLQQENEQLKARIDTLTTIIMRRETGPLNINANQVDITGDVSGRDNRRSE